MSASDCQGSKGVYLNYTIGVEYPLYFWEAFVVPTFGEHLDPKLKHKMVVTNGTTFHTNDPEFSLITLANQASEGVVCGPPPPPPGPVPVGTPPPPDCARNVSGLLAKTGTDITFTVKQIEGASQVQKYEPGMAFGMTAKVSILSQKNSDVCDGEEPFCCAALDRDGNCCCNPNEISAFCGSDSLTFVSPKCSSDTGQSQICSDNTCPIVNNADDCKKHPELYRSDCAAFKDSVYNFTKHLPTSGAPTGGARVDVFPSDPTADAKEFDVLEYFYGALCVHTIGSCPGASTGGPWLTGDSTGAKKTPGEVRIGANKAGEIGNCDSLANKLLRKLGVWGVVFLIFGLVLLVAGLVYAGYKLYQKRQRAKQDINATVQASSLDSSVDINDPAAGTGADFAYADIDSIVS